MGTAVRYVLDCDEGQLVYGEAHLAGNIKALEYLLGEYGMHVSLRVADGLVAILRGWEAELASSEDPDFEKSRTITRRSTRLSDEQPTWCARPCWRNREECSRL